MAGKRYSGQYLTTPCVESITFPHYCAWLQLFLIPGKMSPKVVGSMWSNSRMDWKDLSEEGEGIEMAPPATGTVLLKKGLSFIPL